MPPMSAGIPLQMNALLVQLPTRTLTPGTMLPRDYRFVGVWWIAYLVYSLMLKEKPSHQCTKTVRWRILGYVGTSPRCPVQAEHHLGFLCDTDGNRRQVRKAEYLSRSFPLLFPLLLVGPHWAFYIHESVKWHQRRCCRFQRSEDYLKLRPNLKSKEDYRKIFVPNSCLADILIEGLVKVRWQPEY